MPIDELPRSGVGAQALASFGLKDPLHSGSQGAGQEEPWSCHMGRLPSLSRPHASPGLSRGLWADPATHHSPHIRLHRQPPPLPLQHRRPRVSRSAAKTVPASEAGQVSHDPAHYLASYPIRPPPMHRMESIEKPSPAGDCCRWLARQGVINLLVPCGLGYWISPNAAINSQCAPYGECAMGRGPGAMIRLTPPRWTASSPLSEKAVGVG